MADEIAMVEQLNRTERRLDALEQRVAQVQTDLREFAHAVKVQFEHVHHRFDVVDEQFQSLTEHMDRRFDALERRQAADMAFLKQVLTNDEGRLRSLEDAPGRPT